MIAIVSFLAPVVGGAGGFLRILRTLRLLRGYQTVGAAAPRLRYFRGNEEVIIAVANLVVFLFVMTGVVYETQHVSNPHIANYADALYFTVTALTTTGFGDITLPGTTGRLISVVIMIFGVTLFFGLAKALLRPNKVRFPCPTCGLLRHDLDAVHCRISLSLPAYAGCPVETGGSSGGNWPTSLHLTSYAGVTSMTRRETRWESRLVGAGGSGHTQPSRKPGYAVYDEHPRPAENFSMGTIRTIATTARLRLPRGRSSAAARLLRHLQQHANEIFAPTSPETSGVVSRLMIKPPRSTQRRTRPAIHPD